jgi:hypothetical protein
MNRFFLPLLLLACGFLASLQAAPSPESRLADVQTAFDKGDLRRTHELAESLLQEGHLSPRLFELLGHVRYRQGDLGRAALWYERASLFPPPVPELRQNIFHIRERTGNIAFPANGFRDQFAARLTRTEWLKLAIGSAWVFVFALVIYHLFVRSSTLRTLLMLVRVMAIAITTMAFLGWHWHPSFDKLNHLAFVTSSDTKAYTAATVTSGDVMTLPPGSQVRRLEDRGAWQYIEMPTKDDFKRGWVKAETLTPFWPFAPGYLE